MLSAANAGFLNFVIWAPSSQEVYLTFIENVFWILKEHLSKFKNVISVKIWTPHPVNFFVIQNKAIGGKIRITLVSTMYIVNIVFHVIFCLS